MAKGDPPPRNPVVAKALEKVQLAQDVALVRSAMQGAGGAADKPPKTSAHNHSSGALAMIRKKRGKSEERGEKTKDRETGKGEP